MYDQGCALRYDFRIFEEGNEVSVLIELVIDRSSKVKMQKMTAEGTFLIKFGTIIFHEKRF